jgi:hypothetical protein
MTNSIKFPAPKLVDAIEAFKNALEANYNEIEIDENNDRYKLTKESDGDVSIYVIPKNGGEGAFKAEYESESWQQLIASQAAIPYVGEKGATDEAIVDVFGNLFLVNL